MSYAPTDAAERGGHRAALLAVGLLGAALFALVQAGVVEAPDLEGALTDLSESGTMHCQLIFANGRLIDVGSFLIKAGSGGWGGPAPLTESDLVEVRILAEDGALLGVGRMP